MTRRGIMVRRLLDPDPATGQRRFTDRAFRYDGYQSADLAYAVTGHSAQGATVHTGIALVTGTEDRQWLYPAMTRGTDANLAFVVTTPARPADPQPGTRPAPELDRYERLRRERAGYLAPPSLSTQLGQTDQREPVAVLADILSRDGAELSASAIRQRNLANADHLATLHAIWTAETTAARHDRYRDLVTAALPPGHRQPLSHQARWLYRTLHAAELAGLDPADVIRTAIASRDLAGSRDIAAVLDARIRPRVDPLLPQPQGAWAGRVPRLPDPDRYAYLARIAAMMDDRTRRLGQHVVQTTPAWAITALGPVPADSVARRQWEDKAASIAAYREMYGYDHPDDPIGPEPARQAPDQRAAWHQAFAALGPAGQPDIRALSDGRLWLARDAYAAETAWAPPTSGRSCGCSGSAPSTPPWAPSGPTPRQAPPARPATTTAPRGTRPWPPATGPCATTTSTENTTSPRTWPTGRNGSTPPNDPGAWPSPPTPNCAAATPGGRSSPCVLPNQSPSAIPDADPLHPAADGKLTETAALIRDSAVQREQFRAEMDERPG